jgi:RNA polymerase subunit RPABC4/transcription elongation factor Spt4
MPCSNCGSEISTDARFCPACGTRVQNGRGGGGDTTIVHDISNSQGVAVGTGAQASVSYGVSGEQLADLFAPVYSRIQQRPEEPGVDKEQLKKAVEGVQQEAAKGEQASGSTVKGWLGFVAAVAPDILEVVVATLTNPVAGIAILVRKIAEEVKQEADKKT